MPCEIDREKDRMKFPVFLFKSEGKISKWQSIQFDWHRLSI